MECTLNRVNNERTDQLQLSGHASRIDDLDLFASLGIRALRYPILWEHVWREGKPDWSWADARLERLAELRVEPVVGLLHHGAGPHEEGFFDPDFAKRFADYAASVADRYPWVRTYCPINEPLTTARFCGLYGVWHPHAFDRSVFARILMAQLDATAEAVRAIKAIRSDAVFVQNEDLGTALATTELQYQADFENERRWVTFDLLTGRLGPDDTMWRFLREYGIEEDELEAFAAAPCPPDLIGVDHYVTSDRFLDHRIDRYAEHTHGTNGRHRYANVEAVRATEDGPVGVGPILEQAWLRYERPIAITEAHLGSTRDEQLRWLDEFWRTALDAREKDIDVRAVTVWSLLGAYDWNTLVTERNGFYESGAFDLRSGAPRETAIAKMLRQLSFTGRHDHPVLDTPGWWRRTPERLFHPPKDGPVSSPPPADARRLLVVGPPSGLLEGVERVAAVRNLLVDRVDDLRGALEGAEPWAVIAAAECSWTLPDAPSRRMRSATAKRWGELVGVCADRGIPILYFSCPHVVDGRLGRPRYEDDPVRPSRGCGALAATAEEALRGRGHNLIIRTGPLFGPWDASDPLAAALDAKPGDLDDATLMSPTYIPDVVNEAFDLLIDEERDVWHLANRGSMTERELVDLVHVIRSEGSRVGRRSGPATEDLSLGTKRGARLPAIEDALERYVAETSTRRATPAVASATTGPEFLAPADEPTSAMSGTDGAA